MPRPKNRILLARGPNGSNLDQLFDVQIKANSQNLLILKNNYDISANVHIGNLAEANVENLIVKKNLTVGETSTLKDIVLSGNLTVANDNVSLGTKENPIKDIFVTGKSLNIVGEGNKTVKLRLNSENEVEFVKVNTTTGEVEEAVVGEAKVNGANQSFIELLTQQPRMFKKEDEIISTTSTIDISWNYDNIIPKHKQTEIIAMFSHFNNQKQRSLPYIDKFYFDISNSTTSGWASWTEQTRTVSNTTDYNTDSFKRITITKNSTGSNGITNVLNKEGADNSFDIRVYGSNNSNDYPTVDDRALVFEGLYFLLASPPSIPVFVDSYANSASNKIKFKYKCVETENTSDTIADELSDAVIIRYDATYMEVATRAYNTTIVTTELLDNDNSVSNKNENESFDIELSSLKPGTKYKYKIRARNDLIDTYSDYSDYTTHPYFTRLPSSNSIGTTINNLIDNSSYTNIFISSVQGSQIYINLSDSQNITPDKTSTQTFEITKPYYLTQESITTGYGNGVNGSTGLVTLKVVVNSNTKQTVSYGGFGTTPSNSGDDTSFIDTISQSDIYSSGNNKNFRLKGMFQLNTITNANVSSKIGVAQATAHTLQYKYERHADVGGSDDTTPIHNIYVDNLSGTPGITYTTSTVEVTGIKYTMGIASVRTMKIIINRTYTNCNSVNGFLVRQSSSQGKVGFIGGISNTNFSSEYKYITSGNIDTTTPGSYTHIKTSTGIYYNTTFSNGRNDSLKEKSYAYNLVGTKTGTEQSLSATGGTYNSTTLKHFYDRASYSSNTASSSELNLTTAKIYQIGNISNLASDIAGITSVAYTNHSNVVNDSTLLYIGGKFQGNSTFTYPNTSALNYDNVSVNTYSHGSISYDLNGTSTGDSGYKWVVFDIKKYPASGTTTHYTLLGTNISIQNSDGVNYINLNTGLSGYFDSTRINALFSTSADAVCFVKATKIGTTNIVIATPQGPHVSTSPWYNDGTGTVGWTNLSNAAGTYNKYKCGVSSTGMSIDPTALSDNLQIFIGIKNT